MEQFSKLYALRQKQIAVVLSSILVGEVQSLVRLAQTRGSEKKGYKSV